MAERRKLIAANWKMNGMRADAQALAAELARRAGTTSGAEKPQCDLVVCPPATLLGPVRKALASSDIELGGQDCHPAPKGAFTGDISAEMLVDAGCRYVILGHSERRQGHGESDALVREKVGAARRAGLTPIVCVGETLAERRAGEAVGVVAAQLEGSIPDEEDNAELVIAYEPVWAIGTGLSAGVDDIAEMHSAIRSRLPFDARILYGGSVNPANAAAILTLANVDGALVGTASLAADPFWAIACSCA